MAGEELIAMIFVGGLMLLIPSIFVNLLMLPEFISKIKLKFLGRKGYGTITVCGNDRVIKDYIVKFKGVTKIKKGEQAWNVRPYHTGLGKCGRPQMIVNEKSSEPIDLFGFGNQGKDPETYAAQLSKAREIAKHETLGDMKKITMYCMIAMAAAAVAAFFVFNLQTQLEPLLNCMQMPECYTKLLPMP